MQLSEVYPLPVFARIDDTIIFELRTFDLRAVAWADLYFAIPTKGGIDVMNAALKNPDNFPVYAATVADIAYYLKKDNDLEDYFNIRSLCEFKAKINNKKESEGGSERAVAYLHMALDQVWLNSFLVPKEEDRGGNQKKVEGQKTESVKTNWAGIYADFYMAGGISLEEFSKLTLKHVEQIHPEIMSRKSKDLKNAVALHPDTFIKDGTSSSKPGKMEFSEKDTAILMQDIEKFNQQLDAN